MESGHGPTDDGSPGAVSDSIRRAIATTVDEAGCACEWCEALKQKTREWIRQDEAQSQQQGSQVREGQRSREETHGETAQDGR